MEKRCWICGRSKKEIEKATGYNWDFLEGGIWRTIDSKKLDKTKGLKHDEKTHKLTEKILKEIRICFPCEVLVSSTGFYDCLKKDEEINFK